MIARLSPLRRHWNREAPHFQPLARGQGVPNHEGPDVGGREAVEGKPHLLEVRLVARDLRAIELHLKIMFEGLDELAPPEEAILDHEA